MRVPEQVRFCARCKGHFHDLTGFYVFYLDGAQGRF